MSKNRYKSVEGFHLCLRSCFDFFCLQETNIKIKLSRFTKCEEKLLQQTLREDAHKKSFFVIGPLRGGGVKLPEPLRKKLFFYH